MDGVTLSLLSALIGSQFLVYYKLGRIDERLKNIERKLRIGGKYGKNKSVVKNYS